MMLLTASSSSWAYGNGCSISDLSGVIEAVAAVFNLVLVIYFFIWEHKDYRRREQIRIQEETYSSWYRLFVEERLIVEIDNYFNKIVEVLPLNISKQDAVMDIGELSNIIDQIKSDMIQKKRILIPTLDLFSKEFRRHVLEIFQVGHEEILQKIEKIYYGQATKDEVLEFLNELNYLLS